MRLLKKALQRVEAEAEEWRAAGAIIPPCAVMARAQALTQASRQWRHRPFPGVEAFTEAVRAALELEAVQVRNAVFYQHEAPFSTEEEAEAWVDQAPADRLRVLLDGVRRLQDLSGWPFDHLLEWVLCGTLRPFEPVIVPVHLPGPVPEVVDPAGRRWKSVAPGVVSAVVVVLPPWAVGTRTRKTWANIRLTARKLVAGHLPLAARQKQLLDLVHRYGPPPTGYGQVGPYWRRIAKEMRTTEVAVRRLWARIPPRLRPGRSRKRRKPR